MSGIFEVILRPMPLLAPELDRLEPGETRRSDRFAYGTTPRREGASNSASEDDEHRCDSHSP